MKQRVARPPFSREERGKKKGNAPGEAQWIWGLNPVMELLSHAPHRIVRLYIARGLEGGRLKLLHERAQAAGVPLEWTERRELDQRTGHGVHQGVMAQVPAFAFLSEEALLELALPPREESLLLLLDGVEDPQNLGAIARSALALGASALVIGKNRSVGMTPAVMKASAGALVHLPLARVTNLSRTLERLKEGGYWSLAASPEASGALWELKAKGPWAVIIGGEGRGIGANLLQHADFHVHIPMLGQVSSLNASVSAGIVLYELFRQHAVLKAGGEG